MRLPEELSARYEVKGLLGKGGMGQVFLARERELGREVALKLVEDAPGRDEVRRKRFAREGQVAASLRHPGIVQVHSAGYAGDRPYLAYELVAGARTLDEAMRGVDLPTRVAWIRDAARALGFAHRQGIVHRDVKPANLLVDADGRLRVADFGLASAQGLERLTLTGAFVGTPAYLAPEQATGKEPSGATDVWALGVVLYEALSGVLPFEGASLIEQIELVTKGRRTPLRKLAPQVSPALAAACERALQPDPQGRYPDGEAFADALDAALIQEGRPESAQWIKPVLLLLAVGVGLLLALTLTSGSREAVANDPNARADVADSGGADADAGGADPDADNPAGTDATGDANHVLDRRAGVPSILERKRTLRLLQAADVVEGIFAGDEVLIGEGKGDGPFSLSRLHRGGGPLATWPSSRPTLYLQLIPGDRALLPGPGGPPTVQSIRDERPAVELDLPTLQHGPAHALPQPDGGFLLAFCPKGGIGFARIRSDLSVAEQWTVEWSQAPDQVYAVALDPSGEVLIAVGGRDSDNQGLLRTWDTRTRQPIGRARPLPSYCLAVHPNRQQFLMGTRSSQIVAFDLRSTDLQPLDLRFVHPDLDTASRFAAPASHAGYVNALAYGREGRVLYSAGASTAVMERNDVQLWSLSGETPELLFQRRLPNVPRALCVSEDERYLLVSCEGNQVELFKVLDD